MDLLNIFTLNLFIDVLPDGILSTLSSKSKIVNSLIYYDENSDIKITKQLNNIVKTNLVHFLRIIQLQGPFKLNRLLLNKINIENNEIIDNIIDNIIKDLDLNIDITYYHLE